MWKEFTADGFLKYPNFLETVTQIVPMYKLRVVGGTLYLIGVVVMMYNLFKKRIIKFEINIHLSGTDFMTTVKSIA